jgi:hypothetical protein
MLKTGLEFAPGTTDDCKRLVGRMFSPADILGAYRSARDQFQTGDIVLVASESDADGFDAMPRTEYVARLRRALGPKAAKMMPVLTIAHKTAHRIMNLPFESDALWLVIVRGQQVPSMCVIYALAYKETESRVN